MIRTRLGLAGLTIGVAIVALAAEPRMFGQAAGAQGRPPCRAAHHPSNRPAGRRRPRRTRRRAGAQARARLGRHAQRSVAARIGQPCARRDRAARLRVGPVGHVHPHRLEHHLEDAEEDRRLGGERRSESQQRRRDLLHGPSRGAARRRTARRVAVVRARRQGLRRRARRAHGIRLVAGVPRAARRAASTGIRSAARARSSTNARTFPRRSTSRHRSRSPTSSISRRITRARRSTCCCGSICRTCRPSDEPAPEGRLSAGVGEDVRQGPRVLRIVRALVGDLGRAATFSRCTSRRCAGRSG